MMNTAGDQSDGRGAGIDNLLYSADAEFSCFADLALVSPGEYYKEGEGSLMQAAFDIIMIKIRVVVLQSSSCHVHARCNPPVNALVTLL